MDDPNIEAIMNEWYEASENEDVYSVASGWEKIPDLCTCIARLRSELAAVQSEFAAFRSGKKGIEEHYAALREIERLKASVENWKHEAKCEHDHVIEFMDMNERLKAEIAEMRERIDAINNISVRWQEDGPYEDANTEALDRMMKIYKLSALPTDTKGAD